MIPQIEIQAISLVARGGGERGRRIEEGVPGRRKKEKDPKFFKSMGKGWMDGWIAVGATWA